MEILKDTKWLIWSIEHDAWWRHNSQGYTNILSGAGVYSYEQAVKIVTRADFGLTCNNAGSNTHMNTPEEAMILLTPQIEKQLKPYEN